MKNKLLVNVYDLSIHKKNQKLERLIKIHAKDKKELSRLNDKLAKVKSNKPSKKDTLRRQNKYLHDVQTAKKNVDIHKKKLSKLNTAIQDLKKEIRSKKTEKRDYINTIGKLNRAWKSKTSRPLNLEQQISDDPVIYNFKIHMRSARALLNLSRKEFSRLIGVDEPLLNKIESDSSAFDVNAINIDKSYKKLELAGVEFINDGLFVGFGGVGVRLNRDQQRTPVLNAKKLPKKSMQNKKSNKQLRQKTAKAA